MHLSNNPREPNDASSLTPTETLNLLLAEDFLKGVCVRASPEGRMKPHGTGLRSTNTLVHALGWATLPAPDDPRSRRAKLRVQILLPTQHQSISRVRHEASVAAATVAS